MSKSQSVLQFLVWKLFEVWFKIIIPLQTGQYFLCFSDEWSDIIHSLLYGRFTRCAHVMCSLNNKVSADCCSPHGAALVRFHIHVRDQSEQWRQFMLCSVCDHHSEGEGGGSDVRKQVAVVVRRCWQEDCAIVRMPLLLIPWKIK